MKEETPIISVITPVYNGKEWISRCLESAIPGCQKYGCEMVIVDDGSTDGSAEILEDYAKKYNFIRLYHQENHGCTYSMNQLLDLAKGIYLLSLDIDDYLSERAFDELVPIVREHPEIDILQFGLVPFLRGESPARGDKPMKLSLFSNRDEIEVALYNGPLHQSSHGGKLIRRTMVVDIRYSGTPAGADTRFTRHAFLRSETAALAEGPASFYEVRQESLSHIKHEPGFYAKWLDESCEVLPRQWQESLELKRHFPLAELVDLPGILYKSLFDNALDKKMFLRHSKVLWKYRKMLRGKGHGMSWAKFYLLTHCPNLIRRIRK